ncbi:hypothetical protein K432DRAFT_415385 [Lepidopterella palustris CBS 459.81]|uniref:Major facilitator superfamily (MFS) profile domain-containing protein n=1 Tax=Lepidopterella palustris CBS 459.81 TaxID=1314670 RepID=A0A8E2EEB3_9PEZI|nr:hypothetical protein K432DRAFT_415385 [Lepidopterella palustris CBS 459.81]
MARSIWDAFSPSMDIPGWLLQYSYSVFLSYYSAHNVFPEATSLDYAFIGGLNIGISMLAASPICGFVATSFAERIWRHFLTQGVMVGIVVGFIFTPSVAITSQPFDKRRSLANSVCSAGSGIGGVIRPLMHLFDLKLLRHGSVVLLLSWGFFSMLGYITLLCSLYDLARSIGLSASQASSITALLNLGTAVGRPCVGLLNDRFGCLKVAR